MIYKNIILIKIYSEFLILKYLCDIMSVVIVKNKLLILCKFISYNVNSLADDDSLEALQFFDKSRKKKIISRLKSC